MARDKFIARKRDHFGTILDLILTEVSFFKHLVKRVSQNLEKAIFSLKLRLGTLTAEVANHNSDKSDKIILHSFKCLVKAY